MPHIQVLSPQLANQIAAGEVVERPASVVKEVVENAIDAGATQIDVEIERGGHKRITVIDNGCGIAKDQLQLALARHATSKIKDFDDLEAIMSLGFRGEALASISSVARLTLTSKPAEQADAWSAQAEGLDMAVDVRPAAHPNGTRIDVVDLFYNTPARRRFLKAEKTEFLHVEQVIRRIALSRPDLGFSLKHNGKLVFKVKKPNDNASWPEQMQQRMRAMLGDQFVEQCQFQTVEYDAIKLSLWLKPSALCARVNPAQYAFVNGRMMRDKLIQHAIRQGYAEQLDSEQQPEYLVCIDLPANDVDVNVHPAKHEVRFHHARLLHDLLVKTVTDGIQTQSKFATATFDIEQYEPRALQQQSSSSRTPNPLPRYASHSKAFAPINVAESLLTPRDDLNSESVLSRDLDWQVLHIQSQRFAYCLNHEAMWLIDLTKLNHPNTENTPLDWQPSPLLVPVRISLSDSELAWCQAHLSELTELGFDAILHQHYLVIKQVPGWLRKPNKQGSLATIVTQAMTLPVGELKVNLTQQTDKNWQVTELSSMLNSMTQSQIEQLLSSVGVMIEPDKWLSERSGQ